MKHFIAFLFVFAHSAQSFPQAEAGTPQSGLGKAKSLVALSEKIYQDNIDSVIPLCRLALELLDKTNGQSSDTGTADYLSTKASALNNIGYVLFYKGNSEKALDYYLKALNLRLKTGNPSELAESYDNLGALYKSIGNTNEAIDYYRKSLKLYIRQKNLQGQANLLGNLGVAYDAREANDSALYYYRSAYTIQTNLGDKSRTAKLMNNMALLWAKEGNYTDAMKVNLNSVKTFTELGDKQGLCISLIYLARNEFNTENLSKSLEHAKQSLQLAQQLGFPVDIMDAAKLLYEIHLKQNHLKEALDMQLLYATMKDSVNNEEMQKKILQKEFKFDYDSKEALLKAEQDKKDLLTHAELKKQQWAMGFFLSIALALLAIALLVFQTLKTTRRQNQIIEEKNRDILDSITYAKRLQEAILPPLSLVSTHLPESFVLYKPKDIVAGDFYWMKKINDTLLIAAADSTGHGVPGAMVSVVCSNALNRAVSEFQLLDTGQILDKTRDLVLETFAGSPSQVKDGMDISLLSINKATKKISWSGAYNNLYYTDNGQLSEIRGDKQPIGQSENPVPFTSHSLPFSTDHVFYLLTDGFADQFGGPNGKKYKYKQLENKLLAISDKPLGLQKELLDTEFENWKSSLEQLDDVTIIGLKI